MTEDYPLLGWYTDVNGYVNYAERMPVFVTW